MPHAAFFPADVKTHLRAAVTQHDLGAAASRVDSKTAQRVPGRWLRSVLNPSPFCSTVCATLLPVVFAMRTLRSFTKTCAVLTPVTSGSNGKWLTARASLPQSNANQLQCIGACGLDPEAGSPAGQHSSLSADSSAARNKSPL